jgi:UDP-N-acetylmuramoylalanine--D-glutamate ligase
MGLGVHGGGLGVARWLLAQGAKVTVTDMASEQALAGPLAQLEAAAQAAGATVRYRLGEHTAEDFTSHPIVIVNPAVRPGSPWIAMARAAGAAIETEMTLFFRHCPGPILGITGTKGKTTTATLLGAMLRAAYPDTVVAGNMRVSALASLERIAPTTPVVLELSSFQLMGLGEAQLSPQYAGITNLSPDHLNYHGTMQAYAAAKQQIFAHQGSDGVVVLPYSEARGGLLWPLANYQGQLLSTSMRASDAADATIDGAGWATLEGERLFHRSMLSRGGVHNLANGLMAAALARRFGVVPGAIAGAIEQFEGVEHRQELVAEIDGVRYINDTTATNPAAAIVALESIAPSIVLLAGGADKGLPLEAFAQAIVERAKAVVLLAGSATERLQAEIGSQQKALSSQFVRLSAHDEVSVFGPYSDLTEAINVARELAGPGDAIVLSPGCASFGMFLNEFHRGEEFRRIVNGITKQ